MASWCILKLERGHECGGELVALVELFCCQAEGGIGDLTVTGVQTCALPISICRRRHLFPVGLDLLRATHAEGPVQREINDGVGKWHTFARQRLPGHCRRRNYQRPSGIGLLQTPRERNAGKRFTDTYCMNPDCARGIRRQFGKRRKGESQAFPKVREILSVAQPFHEPVRYQQKGCETHEKAVNEIHLAWLRSVVTPQHAARDAGQPCATPRNEERRVGKECRSRWSPYH